MRKKIVVRELIGEKHGVEDAIIIREIIKSHVNTGVTLDFQGINKISTAFLTTLFNDLILKFGRDDVFSNVNVKNISNTSDYSRVVLGTAFNYQ